MIVIQRFHFVYVFKSVYGRLEPRIHLVTRAHIFDTHTKLTGKINRGFDGHHHPLLQNRLTLSRKPRGFMNLQSHPMPQGMTKIFCQLQARKVVTGLMVNLRSRDSRPYHPDGLLLRNSYGIIDFLIKRRYFTEKEHTCQVALIAVDVNPHVNENRLMVADFSVRHSRVRKAGIGA